MDTGRGQQWGALAALVFTVCCPQQSAAQATITVNTTQQGITNGQCSLQEATYASEFKSNTAINQTSPDNAYTTGCIAGTGNGDTIVLPAGAVFTFDHLWDGDAHNKFGPTATPIILSKITIEGNGATLQWQETFDPGNSRLFAVGTGDGPFGVSGTGNLTLKNVHVRGFHIRGGYGYTGGGGGLGAGGAIYVNEAFLTVENSTFENNGALGGDAVRIDPYDSGGGGEDCREMAVRGATLRAAVAVARVVTAGSALGQHAMQMIVALEEVVAGRFFMEKTVKPETKVGFTALAGFAVVETVATFQTMVTTHLVRAAVVVVVLTFAGVSFGAGRMAPGVTTAVAAAAVRAMVGRVVSAAAAVVVGCTHFSLLAGAAALEEEVERHPAPSVLLPPAKVAPSAAMLTRGMAAAARWAAPYSITTAPCGCTTAPSSTIG